MAVVIWFYVIGIIKSTCTLDIIESIIIVCIYGAMPCASCFIFRIYSTGGNDLTITQTQLCLSIPVCGQIKGKN